MTTDGERRQGPTQAARPQPDRRREMPTEIEGLTETQIHEIAVRLIDTGFKHLLSLVRDGSPGASLAARRAFNRYSAMLAENQMIESESLEA